MKFFRWRITENGMLITLAVLLGLGTGAALLLFRAGINFFYYLLTDVIGAEGFIGHWLASWNLDPHLSILVTLTLAGALVGLIMQTFVGEQKYHGVAGIMEAVALAGGRLRYKLIPFKAVASAISLGAGASVGPEDPSVQIGSNLGSFLGQALRLSEDRVKLLVASGAASAIASAFNAPIAGVFFALEVILGEFTTASFGVVVLAAVISSGFTQYFGGSNPIFGDLEYTLGSPIQLPFYVLLGVILAFFSSMAIRFFHWQADLWHHRINLPLPLETALTGALVAIVSLAFPQILFYESESFMHDLLSGHIHLSLALMLGILIAKLVMTAISSGGGFVGGVFAPTLFMGIVLGSIYGRILNALAPSSTMGNPQSYAIAGMAGLLAGIIRAPITAILMVFELTDDYSLILPIMLTSVVCTLVIERLGPAGIYMWALIKNGLHLQQGRDVDVMQGIAVHEAMLKPAPTIAAKASLRQLRDAFHAYNTRAVCVLDEENKLIGIVTLGDLQNAYEEAMQTITEHKPIEGLTVGDICIKDVLTVEHSERLWTAIQIMGARDIGRMPVIDKRTGALVGILRRQDIMQAYNTAVARKLQDQHYAEQIRLQSLTGAHVLEYVVNKQSTTIDKEIREIHFPSEAVVASISRGGKLIVPHGDTRFRLNDKVTIVANQEAEPILELLFKGKKS